MGERHLTTAGKVLCAIKHPKAIVTLNSYKIISHESRITYIAFFNILIDGRLIFNLSIAAAIHGVKAKIDLINLFWTACNFSMDQRGR